MGSWERHSSVYHTSTHTHTPASFIGFCFYPLSVKNSNTEMPRTVKSWHHVADVHHSTCIQHQETKVPVNNPAQYLTKGNHHFSSLTSLSAFVTSFILHRQTQQASLFQLCCQSFPSVDGEICVSPPHTLCHSQTHDPWTNEHYSIISLWGEVINACNVCD